MTYHGHCPQCETPLADHARSTGHAICDCGWYDDHPASVARRKGERKVISAMIVTSLVLVAVFAHFINWGSYAATIPFVKLQEWTGTLSVDGYEQLAQACIDLGKYTCAADAYLDKFRDRRDVKGLAQLGKLKMQLGRNDEALKAYEAYVKVGGVDAEASYLYGKLLERANRFTDALAQYESSIAQTDAKALPLLPTGAIVGLLIKQGRYDEAYDRINAFQEIGGEQAKGYLNTELAQLDTYFDSHPSRTHKSSTRGTAKSPRRNGKPVVETNPAPISNGDS